MLKRISKSIDYYKRYFIIVSFIISILLLIFSFYSTFNITAISNDECVWTPHKISKDSLTIIFSEVKKGGVAENAGIKNGDQLLEIDGKRVRTAMEAAQVFNSFPAGKTVEYTIVQDGTIKKVSITVKKFINFANVANSLLALFWIMIGFTVVMSKPEGALQNYFYLIGLSFSFQSFIAQYVQIRYYEHLGIMDVLLQGVGIVMVSYLPYWFIMFFSTFPRISSLQKTKWFRPLFFYISLVLVIISSFVFFNEYSEKMYYQISMGITRTIVGIYYQVGIVGGLVFLIISFIRIKSREKRKEVFLILISYILLIVTSIYANWLAPRFSGPIFNSPEIYLPIFLIVLFPIAFGVSIYKYHLLDFSIVVKNTIIYGAATLFLAAIYFLSIYGLGISVGTVVADDYKNLVVAISFVLFAFIFQSTKDRFQDLLTKKFYPEEFSQQRILIEFNRELANIVGLENILERIQHTFVQTLKIEKFGIMLRSENNNLVMTNSVGIKKSDINIDSNEINKFINNKFRPGDDIAIEQHNFNVAIPKESMNLTDEGIFTIIPMIIKSEVVGLLLFGLKHSGRQFAGKDLELLYAVAAQSAISIENARLYLAEAEKITYDREMELAYKIQQNLLPKSIPVFPELDIFGKMIPAKHVGGDYYDVIPIGKRKLFIALGDVSGKGVSASFYMTKLQTLLEFMCNKEKEPLELLKELNDKMLDVIDKENFITLNLGFIDLDKMSMKFCRAGHLPLYMTNGEKLSEYKPKGIGLGICRRDKFELYTEQIEIDIKQNDVIVFVSDGITETMNSKNELFSEEKLKALILAKNKKSSVEIFNTVYKEVLDFRNGVIQADDITGLIVRVK